MRCRPRLSPVRRRIRKVVALLLAVIVLCTVYFEIAVKSLLGDVIVRQMQTLSVKAVNTAVSNFLSDNFDIGNKLVSLSYNSGAVAAVTTDPAYINYVKTEITSRAQTEIDRLSHSGAVSAHIGSFTGLILLAEVGPVITLDVDTAQTISCEFCSTFDSAGLNQTLHHITLTVNTEVTVYNPFRIRQTVDSRSDYEIAQTVIVGEVPSYGSVLTY